MVKAPRDGSLLQCFLAEEYDDRTRQRLLDALTRAMPHLDEVIFDRWEVVFDKRERMVTVVDVLDGSSAGEQRLSFEDFEAALDARNA